MESAAPTDVSLQLGEVIRSHAVAQGQRALSLLESFDVEPGEELDPETVHALRVTSKRLRAMGQWLRPFLDRDLAQAADRRLRDAARRLASDREEHVLGLLYQDLERQPAPPSAVAGTTAGGARVADLAALAAAFSADLDLWRRLEFAVETRDLMVLGLGRTLKHVVAREARARSTRKAKAFHAWRKWLKYLRYQLEVLELGDGSAGAEALHQVRRLGSRLGEHHDLAELRRHDRSGRYPLSEPARRRLRSRLRGLEEEILDCRGVASQVSEALDLP